ncbi:MAG: hypothetical protein WBM46_08210 [Polyangiales bacterium]
MSDAAADQTIAAASTVIVLREASEGFETFMLCRHQQSGFMGGAHVFPGGKVDADDREPFWRDRVDRPAEEITAQLGETDVESGLALLVAAVRETFEESGVLLGTARTDVDLRAARERLNGGVSFTDLAQEMGLTLDSTALTPYARWVTPKMESRRFDTRFYVALLPEGQIATHDGTETTSARWLRPLSAIDDMLKGRIKLAPPTVRTLQWLMGFGDAKSAIDDASSRMPPLVRPRIVAGPGGWFLALPGDPEHPEREPALPGATRMVLEDGAWRDAAPPVR